MKKQITLLFSITMLAIKANAQLPLKAIATYTLQNNSLIATDSNAYVFNPLLYILPTSVTTDLEEMSFDSVINYQRSAGEWLAKVKIEKEFNAAAAYTLKANHAWDNGGWRKNSRQLRAYDANGNVAEIQNQFGNSSFDTWNNVNKLSRGYDNLGREFLTVNYDGAGLGWTMVDSTQRTFAPVGLLPVTTIKYKQTNSAVVATSRSGVTNNITTYENYNFQTQVWENYSRTTFFAGGGNVPDSTLEERWNINNGWVLNGARAQLNFGDRPIKIAEYYVLANNFSLGKRYTYEYRSSAPYRLSYSLYENPLPQNELENLFDANENIIRSNTTTYMNGSAKTVAKTYNTYNDQNLLTQQLITSTNIQSGVTDSVSRAAFTYQNGQLQTWDYKVFNIDSNRCVYGQYGFLKIYYYTDTTTMDTTTTTALFNANQLKGLVTLYPMPSNGAFAVESSLFSIQSIDIYDMKGQFIMHQEVNKPAAQVNTANIKDGTYVLYLKTAAGVLKEKIVIQH